MSFFHHVPAWIPPENIHKNSGGIFHTGPLLGSFSFVSHNPEFESFVCGGRHTKTNKQANKQTKTEQKQKQSRRDTTPNHGRAQPDRLKYTPYMYFQSWF